jgi:hypothetical protein
LTRCRTPSLSRISRSFARLDAKKRPSNRSPPSFYLSMSFYLPVFKNHQCGRLGPNPPGVVALRSVSEEAGTRLAANIVLCLCMASGIVIVASQKTRVSAKKA